MPAKGATSGRGGRLGGSVEEVDRSWKRVSEVEPMYIKSTYCLGIESLLLIFEAASNRRA
jgi:hypothetical protein